MASTTKDTIYIDIDDEITSIIDKIQASDKQIVALVLPKRATVLQSIVNMRLLKRTAESSKKRLVLITSETGLLPLAGAVGLHVAKTLQSKPEVPPIPDIPEEVPEVDDSEEVPLDSSAPIGQLAGIPAETTDDDVIEVDNDANDEATTKSGKKSKDKKKKGKKEGFNKKLKVPNFEKFRVWIFIGIGALIALILLWFLLNSVLPKATITIKTDTSTANSDVTFTASPNTNSLDKTKLIVPATKKEYKKADSEKVSATGTKDKGTAASGTMTLTNCINDGQPHTVPAGTTFTSGQFGFTTAQDVVLDPALFSGSSCKSATFGLSKNVAVTAAQVGDQSNLSSRSYNSPINGINAQGSAMAGGTSNIVKVVAQSDIDGAKQKILDRDVSPANDELKKEIQADNKLPINETSSVGTPAITTSAKVGDEASDVTVNTTTSYTMFGVKESDLKPLIDADVKDKIDTSKQGISDYGLTKASFKVLDKPANGDMRLEMQTTVTVGVRPDVDAIRQEVAGKKKGDTIATIQSQPGVKDVSVKYSPFWVYKTPKKQSRISVNFEKVD